MTVGDLREIIKDLPDEMEIGSGGHFGEFLECHDIWVGKVSMSFTNRTQIEILKIDIENPGPAPD